MIAEFDEFLDRNTSPEFASMMRHAATALMEFGIVSHESDLHQTLGLVGQLDTILISQNLALILSNKIEEALIANGVTVNTGDLGIKADILDGLWMIQNYKDPDQIARLCESDNDSIGILCECLGLILVPKHNVCDLEVVITKVHPNTIDSLHKLVEADAGMIDDIVKKSDASLVKRAKAWVDKHPESLASVFIRNQIGLGYEADYYASIIPGDVVETMETSPERTALEITGLVMISSTKDKDIRDKIHSLFDEFFVTLDLITKADVISDRLLNEVYQNGATTIPRQPNART